MMEPTESPIKSRSNSSIDLHANTSMESFEKIKLIGKGDVGKVYLVQHKETRKIYAMKVLDKQEMIKRNKVKRTLTEREILATAEHPFIVTLYWCFQSSDKLYFVMEYCAGGEFFRMLQKQPGKCMPEESCKFYAAEVLLALEYLHLKGFVYRDLKPENILLHATGHIMLTDFDLSKQAASSASPQVIKKIFSQTGGDIYSTPEITTNSFVGTAEYIAPEIIKGYGQSSGVDWWCFGILIYEMLYGSTPFKGRNQDDTFSKILEGDIDFPENHDHSVSSTCKSLIKKLLANDPKKRLGAEHGAADVKKHKWFSKINFTLIRNMTPPYIPKISSTTDTSHFRSLKDEETSPHVDQEEVDTETFQDFKPITKTPKKEGIVPRDNIEQND